MTRSTGERWIGLLLAAVACIPSCRSGETPPAASQFAPAAFPLRVAPDRRTLIDRNATPFLLHGDSAWSLIAKLKNEAVEDYLSDRQRRGFNAVLVNLLEHKFAEHPPANAYGQAPFTRPGDFTAPNESYFAHVDWVLRCAARHGIAVLLAPAYLGQKGGDEGFYQELVKSGADAQRSFGNYIGKRYAAFDNIVWVLGGDYLPPSAGLALVRALGEGIRAQDTRHLFTAHWTSEVSSQDVPEPTLKSWLDLNATYTYGSVYRKSLSDFVRPDALPHFLIEAAYENEHDSTPQSLRAQAYAALLTGATGQVFGSSAIWGFWSWRTYLGSKGSVSMMHVRALFEPRAWYRLVPDERHIVLVSGHADDSTVTHATAMLANTPDGDLAIAYVPSRTPITIDVTQLHTPLLARWYDPSSGTFSAVKGSPIKVPVRLQLKTPGDNAAGDADWLLVLEHTP